jgi:hypothetical protein
VSRAPARTLAAAGTAGTGAVAAAAAYLAVRGLPGVLYAAGICMAAFVGAVAIVAGRTTETFDARPGTGQAPRASRWSRKSRVIADLELELATTASELEEHRHALANLATQLSRESEAAQRSAERLEQRIRELEAERNSLRQVMGEERDRFEQTLEELGGGIGRHGNELAELERELEKLIAR